MSDADGRFIARALELAARGLETATPNPRVGCVLVRDGRAIGEGWHARTGEKHAERAALASLAADLPGAARGATAYVTLEPCSHHGRTPPCTDALIEAGVARVVVCTEDPDPRVRGRGIAQLREAGIAVEIGAGAAAARALNAGFFKRMATGRPLVRLKLAASLDGRTALASGESRWITGEAARADVQRLRARSCAVLTGSGTVLADDPRLDVRTGADARQPLRVVLDTRLRVPPTARTLAPPGRVLVLSASADAARRAALEAAGAEVLTLPAGGAGVDLAAALDELGRRELNEIHVEAGATLAGALLAGGLADELVLYSAPVLLGSEGRAMLEIGPIGAMADRLELGLEEVVRIGEDLRIVARPRRRPERG